MNSQCETVRNILVEGSNDLDQRESAVESHMEGCVDCRKFAASEERLVEYFKAASPPGDPVLQQRVIMAVQDLEARRRRMALMPVAASAILALVGVTVLGGVPGASLVAALPAWAGSGWVAVVGSVMDFAGALRAVAGGLAGVISGPVFLGAAIVVMAGVGTMVSISKRWRRRAVWPARS